MIRLTEKQSGGHIAWDERKIGAIVTIEYLLRTGSSYYSNKRIVMVGVTAIKPVGYTIDLIFTNDVGKIDMSIVDGDTKVEYSVDTSPIAKADGDSIGVLFVKAMDIFYIVLYSGT
jgi:hypothetical protein